MKQSKSCVGCRFAKMPDASKNWHCEIGLDVEADYYNSKMKPLGPCPKPKTLAEKEIYLAQMAESTRGKMQKYKENK